MALPLSTTTVTVTRNQTEQGADPYDSTPNVQTVATNVRAVVSPPSGAAKLVGGTRVVYDAQLRCDTVDPLNNAVSLLPQDTVTDCVSGLVWTVLSASQVTALGQDFWSAQVRKVTGAT